MPGRNINPQGVFLNVPFGPTYERRFVSLVAALVSIGRQPHCALEISGGGKLRLNRIFQFMSRCRVSIHDLSHVGRPVRFNMPFELGIACALVRYRKLGAHLPVEVGYLNQFVNANPDVLRHIGLLWLDYSW